MSNKNKSEAKTEGVIGVGSMRLLGDAVCQLCVTGFPLLGFDHIPTQSLGMIPVCRCRKHVKRADIKRYRNYLNYVHSDDPKHRNGRYRQIKRQYGDYLYHQDREKFMVDMCVWLASPNDQALRSVPETDGARKGK